MDEGSAPAWVIVETRISCEEIVEKALRSSGYRVYLARYRKLLAHGRDRRPSTAMRPLFARLVFAQDFRGWTDAPINGVLGLMKIGQVTCKLSDSDVEIMMSRERAGDFDEARYPRVGKQIREDIVPGDEVEIDMQGRRVMAVLRELSPDGRAIVEAMILGRMTKTEVDAEVLRATKSA
jgi:hypothetical protein